MDERDAGGGELLSTGIPGLDDVLRGGLAPGHLYLVEGDAGAGKTTLGLQFLLEGKRRGERTLWCTLSETERQLQTCARSHGWELSGVETCNLAAPSGPPSADAEYSFFSPADIELGDVTRAAMGAIDRVKPARLVFDPFSDVRQLARDPLRYRRQVLALREFCTARGCTVLLLQERSPRAPGDDAVEGIVQGIVVLDQHSPEYGKQRRRLRVHKMRGVAFREGFHDCAIVTGGLVVYPRLVASEHFDPSEREVVPCGVPELDTMLGGGLDRGSSLLIMGPAGVGKSTLTTQFALAAVARGERAALFLFEETTRAFVTRGEGLGMGVRAQLERGALTVRQVDPAEFTPGEFAHLVRRAVEHDAARLVVIDSLNGYLNGMPDEHHLSLHLHELFTYLAYRNVVTILTMNQHGIMGEEVRSPAEVSYLADTAVMLRYFEAFGRVRRSVSVVKRRTGSHEVQIRELTIAPPGLKVGRALEEFQGVLTGQPRYTGRAGGLEGPGAGGGDGGPAR